jgi:hypothetical protein
MAQVEPIFGKPERQEKVKGSHLRQSEFSRKMQALDRQKEELEADMKVRENLVFQDKKALETWKGEADAGIIANQNAAQEARVKYFALTEKMKNLATQYGADPKDWGVDGELKPPDTKQAPDTTEFDKRYLGRPDADRLLQEVKSSPYIAAELEDIVDEHRGLFNKGLNRKELVTNALKNKRTLREEWEVSNEISKRRDELKEKQIEERIRTKVDEERTKILSEQHLPVPRGETSSPILSMREDLKLSGIDRSKPSGASALDAAMSSFNVRKYEVSKPGTGKTE